MSKLDMNKYSNIDEVYRDIKALNIQGATNVALSTFYGLKLHLEDPNTTSHINSFKEFLNDLKDNGYYLAQARTNEPLAKNGVAYIVNKLKKVQDQLRDKNIREWVDRTVKLCDEYIEIIKAAKLKIIANSDSVFDFYEEYFKEPARNLLTHCHSSTAESIIINYINKQFKSDEFHVTCTETRPRYQGRITAKNLLEKGINTSLIVDSGVEGYILDKGHKSVEMVFIGCDQITPEGDTINKIGSWGVALAAQMDKDPIYVVTSLLKIDLNTHRKDVKVEMRDPSEVWENAPKGLKIINPAFEMVDSDLITAYITEAGIIPPDRLQEVAVKHYSWLKEF